jgi:hypothetical protein
LIFFLYELSESVVGDNHIVYPVPSSSLEPNVVATPKRLWLKLGLEGSETHFAVTAHANDFGPTTSHEFGLEYALEGLFRLCKLGRRHGRS